MGPPSRADAIHQHRPHLQQNDTTLVITVEAEAENDAANGDLGCGSVEEEVLLAVGEDGKGRE